MKECLRWHVVNYLWVFINSSVCYVKVHFLHFLLIQGQCMSKVSFWRSPVVQVLVHLTRYRWMTVKHGYKGHQEIYPYFSVLIDCIIFVYIWVLLEYFFSHASIYFGKYLRDAHLYLYLRKIRLVCIIIGTSEQAADISTPSVIS